MVLWKRVQYRRARRRCLIALDSLQQSLFACYLRMPAPPALLTQAHRRLFHAMQPLRCYGRPEQVVSLERLYETILLIGQLRFRVTDKTQYDVCRDEMQHITHAISLILRERTETAFALFDQARDNFQTLFQGVLAVTAYDPDMWEFFVSHLDAFRREAMRQMEGESFVAV